MHQFLKFILFLEYHFKCLWLRAGRSGDRIPVGGEIFLTCPDRPWGPPSPLYNGYRVSFPGVKSGRGVTVTPHPLLVPRPRKSRAMGSTACTEPQCLYKGALYLLLYMFRTVFPSIIRSSTLYIQQQVYVRQIPVAVCTVSNS